MDATSTEELKSSFELHGEAPQSAEFLFPKTNSQPGRFPLRTVIANYVGAPQAAKVPAEKMFQILGRLRSLQHVLKRYNEGLATVSHGFVTYWRQYTVNLLSGFGFRLDPEPQPIRLDGLDDLVESIQNLYRDTIEEARSLIKAGKTTFTGLSEVFRPGQFVKASIVSGNTPSVFRVTDSYFEERRAIFGSQKLFHVTLEFVVSVGEHFSVATFNEVFTAWHGEQPRNLADFTYQPVSEQERHGLLSRAERAVNLCRGGAQYLAYESDAFFIHASRTRGTQTASMSQATHSSMSRTGGRIMVDSARGASLGHHPCQGVDEATLSIIQLSTRHRQWLSKRSQSDSQQSDALVVFENIPEEFLITLWPALVGFSFTAKTWGHVLVSGLSEIKFQDHAFDKLVLSHERKQLIRAVVRCGSRSQSQDLISGKQGGLIFLLHGPPGVGKTLTAEAVAEVLHRPLYYVTMGELGTNPDDLERRLTDVLDLCAEWDALAVLDEADVFLEKRTTSDLVRNAMVCVMLRILEYHPGILFLTTNRVRTIDPAFESRITLAVRYEDLSHDGRTQVWKSQSDGVGGSRDLDYEQLASHRLNGRQIKHTVRLALSVAADQGIELTQDIMVKTMEVTSLGRQNMQEDDTWTESTRG